RRQSRANPSLLAVPWQQGKKQGISPFSLELTFDRLENAAVIKALRENSLTRRAGNFFGSIREIKSKNPGDQGGFALHCGTDRRSFVDPADRLQYRADHLSYIGRSHRQQGSHRTMMGGHKGMGLRYHSFWANQSRNSSSASTWSS